ncbi:MAG: hypothetical protein WBW04_11295, partial [Nitrolancea sp.]
VTGAVAPIPCAVGFHQPLVGQTSCILSDNFPPAVTVSAPLDPVKINSATTLTAMIDDSLAGDSNIDSASWTLKDTNGATLATGTFSGSTFGSPTVTVSDTIPGQATPGVDTLCVDGTDSNGNTAESCILFVVYDPSSGFVTGGGWIDSPAGAYVADPTMTGKATFGFVAKYKKGQSVPDGNTEFQFKAGNLNFHSTSYQWLVVNQGGNNAQFKGTGTINGSGSYDFMIWATQGSKGSPDTFRIQIIDNSTGQKIYDNGVGQSIGGGSIVIHK